MTKEQKDKLEQEVKAYTTPYIRNYGQRIGDIVRQDFISIYQNILENPQEWGLETTKEALTGRNRILSLQLKNTELQSQLAKYREALERIAKLNHEMDGPYSCEIAKEALKQ